MRKSFLILFSNLVNNLILFKFRFPKNPNIRLEWLNQCGFSEDDIVSNRKICSLHFEPTCYKSADESNSVRKILKPGSIPTIFKKGHTILNDPKCTQ